MATDADIQLSDMLESYPPSMTPNFQTIITAKKEFSELSSLTHERLPPGRGKYFRHQKFTHRYLRAYDDLIIISATGSGKSCESLGFFEYTRRELEKSKIDPTSADEKVAHFKRVIILYKGQTQKEELRNQLACKCSDGHYETGIVRKAKNARVQKSNLSLELKKAGYVFSTYTTFAHHIAKNYPTDADNARLIEDYSDTIFWIDEAHNLLVDPGDVTKFREKQQTYSIIWKVLHLARRCKRLISTATPMINDPKELGSLLNLILPFDGVLPVGYDYRTAPDNDIRVLFPGLPYDHRIATPEQMAPYFRGQIPANFDFQTATLQDLEPFLRGRIGYIRAADTGAIPEEQGIAQNDIYEINGVRYQSQLVLYPTAMSEHQSFGVQGGGGGYIMASQGNKGRDDIFGAERQAANFVFPDGYWGNGVTEEEREARKAAKQAKEAAKAMIAEPVEQVEQLPEGGMLPIMAGMDITDGTETGTKGFEQRAFRRYVTVRGDQFAPTQEFSYWLSDLAYIKMLSCKYEAIVRLVTEEPGNAFVYGEYVDGSGSIVLALCFEGMGYARYDETMSMFLGIGADTLRPLCSGSDRDPGTRRVRPDILSYQQGGPRRYAILTGETSRPKFESMMEAINSYENRYGDYIKVLISSRVGRDAINVNNVLQLHLVGGEWNQSAMYQAISRGIRATSQDDLLKEEQEKLRLEGKDPSTARISVKIYKHAAVALDDANSSIDIQMYRMAEYKDRNIRRIMRILKQCAIGCQVHYDRNVRPSDVDGSATCDYDVCQYQCVDPPPTEEDYTTYDVLYADEVIEEASRDIIEIYRHWNALTLDNIASALTQYRRKYLVMALERLITNKTPLTDRFGYTTYLREDNGSFYLDRSYPIGSKPSYAMSYYTQGIIAIEQESLANIVVKLEAGEHAEVLKELETMDPKDPQFDMRLNAISIEGQASILEAVIIRALRGQRSNFTDAIILKYQRMIFQIHEPVTELNKVYEQMTLRKPKRGRKRNPESKRRLKKLNPINIDETNLVKDETTEMIYLHTLYSQVANQTAYATTARFNKAEGRTRLLKPSEIDDGWRDLNDLELPVYNAFIQIEIAKRVKPLEDRGLYGFILPDKQFRIRDRLTEDPGATNDARRINRGRVCEKWYKPDLIDVMWEIGVQEPGGIFPDFTENNRPQMIQFLLQKQINKTYEDLLAWDFKRLVYYYKWYMANRATRVAICQLIKNRMAETGLLLE